MRKLILEISNCVKEIGRFIIRKHPEVTPFEGKLFPHKVFQNMLARERPVILLVTR